MDTSLKWGVIGSGGIARRRTIREGIMMSSMAKLVSVYDIDPSVNLQVANEFGVSAAQDIRDLLKMGIDSVYVASPVNFHLEHVTACAKAKKHVLCEKPLGLNVQEVRQMMAVCRDNGVRLGVGLMMRYHAQHQAALKILQRGELGKPVYGRAQLSCWYPPIEGAWRQDPATGGGGALTDMGSHCMDLLQMFFGKVKSVYCYIGNSVHNYKSEDSAIVSMKFDNGALATVDTFFCIPDNSSKNCLELYGSNGSILATGTIGQGSLGEMVAIFESHGSGYDAQQLRASISGINISPDPVNMYRAEIEEFSRAVLEGREPEINAEIGMESQKLIAACYQSAKTGCSVEL